MLFLHSRTPVYEALGVPMPRSLRAFNPDQSMCRLEPRAAPIVRAVAEAVVPCEAFHNASAITFEWLIRERNGRGDEAPSPQ